MKRRAYIFYSIVIAAGLMISFFVGRKMAFQDPPATATNVKTAETNSEAESVTGYWLKLENDVIVIYGENKKNLIAETDIHSSVCSARDQKLLKTGIYMEDIDKLFKFLQSHTS